MSSKKIQPPTKLNPWWLVVLGCGTIGFPLLAAWQYHERMLVWFPDGYNNRGLFGDQFGALNVVFSGVASLGLLVTLYLTYRRLRLMHDERYADFIDRQQNAATQKDLQVIHNRAAQITANSALLQSLNTSLVIASQRVDQATNVAQRDAATVYRSQVESEISKVETRLKQVMGGSP